MKVSVIIPVHKAKLPDIQSLVRALKRQTLPPHEILLIETCIGPGSLHFDSPDIRCLTVSPSEFDHGATRNMGVRETSGDIVVFLTQDAEPADDQLIENLTAPLIDPRIPASYGRQLPRHGAKPTEVFARLFNYPDKLMVKGAGLIFYMGIKAVFFSNVCSAVKRSAWEEAGGFPEPVILSEDMILANKLVKRGYQIAYVPDAKVIHSHDYSLSKQFRRYFDIGCMFRENTLRHGLPSPTSEGLRFFSHQSRYLIDSRNIAWLPYSLAEIGAKFAGFQLGRRAGWLPKSVQARLSMNKGYWRNAARRRNRKLDRQPSASAVIA